MQVPIWIIVAVVALIAWLISRSRSSRVDRPERVQAAEPVASRVLVIVPERDSWEGGFWEAKNPRDVETLIHLDYVDAEGSRTARVVKTRSFDDRLLIGFCQLRTASRTFRFDRVRQAVDVATGEILPDLHAHLIDLYSRSPQHARDTLTSDYGAVLQVLLYVAKADGQYRREEKAIVRAFLRELVSDHRLTDGLIDEIFNGLKVPSLQAFKAAVSRVHAEQLVDPVRLNAVCEQMVATQAIVAASEREALEYLQAQLPVMLAPFGQSVARSGAGASA